MEYNQLPIFENDENKYGKSNLPAVRWKSKLIYNSLE